MSKYEEKITNITDGKHLVAAICSMGFKPVVHEEPQHLFGFQGDQRPEKATIVIPRAQISGLANDVGFIREDGKYKAIISDYDSRRFSKSWLGKLTQAYKEAQSVATAKARGYGTIIRSVAADGKVRLEIEVR